MVTVRNTNLESIKWACFQNPFCRFHFIFHIIFFIDIYILAYISRNSMQQYRSKLSSGFDECSLTKLISTQPFYYLFYIMNVIHL